MSKKNKTGKIILSKGLMTALKIVLIVFIILSLIFIAARTIGGVTLKSLVSDIKTSVSNLGTGEGYPYRLSGTDIEKTFSDSSNIFVFCEGEVPPG